MNKIKIFLIAGIIALLGTNAFAYCYAEYYCASVNDDCWCEDFDWGTYCECGPIADYAEEPTGGVTSFVTPSGDFCTPPAGKTLLGWRLINYPDSAGYGNLTSFDTNVAPSQAYYIHFTPEYAANGCDADDWSNEAYFTFAAVYGDDLSPTSKKYVDAEMAKLQPKFAGLGNNKLMTYSSTTNGAVGSRDIVTELGTSTTANTIPTIGAINTGVNTKQDTLNGTDGFVVANTGASGIVMQKPVYSTTDNYKNALVEAGDLNQIIVDAVNSELIPVEGIGWQINTAENLTLPTLRWFLDPHVVGTSSCHRPLDGKNNIDGTCSTATLATLGASGNKSCLWGVVYPYGEVIGKSVCSATAGTKYEAATDAQESTLTTEFNTQSGVGASALSSSQKHCWCKIDKFNGESVGSSWVFFDTYTGGNGTCANTCVGVCADRLTRYVNSVGDALRVAMFSTLK